MKDVIKAYIIAGIITLGFLAFAFRALGISYISPELISTSTRSGVGTAGQVLTIVGNSSTWSAATGGGGTTTTINGLQPATDKFFLLEGTNISITTSSPGNITINAVGSFAFVTTTINGLSQTAYTFTTSTGAFSIATSAPGTVTWRIPANLINLGNLATSTNNIIVATGLPTSWASQDASTLLYLPGFITSTSSAFTTPLNVSTSLYLPGFITATSSATSKYTTTTIAGISGSVLLATSTAINPWAYTTSSQTITFSVPSTTLFSFDNTSGTLSLAPLNTGAGTEVPTDGGLLITNTNNTDIGLQIYSNLGATANSPLMLLRADNTAFDDGILRIMQDGTAGGAYSIRIDDPNPDIELVETDQTSPAGKFEIDVNNNTIRFNSRNAVDNGFETNVLLAQQAYGGQLFIGSDGNVFSIPINSAKLELINTSTTLDYFRISSATSTNLGNIFIVNSSGSIGLGTSNPSSTLHVIGSSTISELVSSTNLWITNATTTKLAISSIASNNCLQTTAGGFIQGTGSACGSGGGSNTTTTIAGISSDVLLATSSLYSNNSIFYTTSSQTITLNYPKDLDIIATLATSTGNLIVGSSTGWTALSVGSDNTCLIASSTGFQNGIGWGSCSGGGGDGGITSINGLTALSQTFATSTLVNGGFQIQSAGSEHTFRISEILDKIAVLATSTNRILVATGLPTAWASQDASTLLYLPGFITATSSAFATPLGVSTSLYLPGFITATSTAFTTPTNVSSSLYKPGFITATSTTFLAVANNLSDVNSSGTSRINLGTASSTINFTIGAPSSTTDTSIAKIRKPYAFTIKKLICNSDAQAAVLAMDIRANATPNTEGTRILTTDLSCGTGIASTTAFDAAGVNKEQFINVKVTSTNATAPAFTWGSLEISY